MSSLKNRLYFSLYNMYNSKPTEPPKLSQKPIWLFGQSFENKTWPKEGVYEVNGHMHRFLEEFCKIIYFSYRKEFPLIQEYNATTDTGWGCLIRTAQMLLARVLCVIYGLDLEEDEEVYVTLRRKIVTLFLDAPDMISHPFSIHSFITKNITLYGHEMKEDYHKHEFWLSPTKIALILKELVLENPVGRLEINVSLDGTVYEESIWKLAKGEGATYHAKPSKGKRKCNGGDKRESKKKEESHKRKSNLHDEGGELEKSDTDIPNEIGDNTIKGNDDDFDQDELCKDYTLISKHSDNVFPDSQATIDEDNEPSKKDMKTNKDSFKPVFVLIPNRLGINKLNPVYIEHIKECLKSQLCVGIIGGKPSKSLYFVGFQDQHILYLDPHFIHSTVPQESLTKKEVIDTYHIKYPLKMKMTDIDPSMAVGFLIRSEEEFISFKESYQQFMDNKDAKSEPIFTLQEKMPDYMTTTQQKDEILDDFELV